MQPEFKLKQELRAKFYSTEKLLDGYMSYLRKELPPTGWEILDVGCGDSLDILDLIKREHKFTAVDSDNVPLEILKKRIEELNPQYLEKVKFINGEFPQENLPYENYDAILFNNLLHFFTLKDLINIFKSIIPRLKIGCLISVVVHSNKHPLNKAKPPNRSNFFKHYFKFTDLRRIFPPKKFSEIIKSDMVIAQTAEDISFTKLWCREVYTKIHKYTDQQMISDLTNQYLKTSKETSFILHYVIRKL